MKTYFPATLAVLFSTLLTTWCCHASGMPRHDLFIAGAVAFVVSASVAYTVAALQSAKQRR